MISLQLLKAFPYKKEEGSVLASPTPSCCLPMALWKPLPWEDRHLDAVLWVQVSPEAAARDCAEGKGHLSSVENIPFLLSILGLRFLLSFSEVGISGDEAEGLL